NVGPTLESKMPQPAPLEALKLVGAAAMTISGVRMYQVTVLPQEASKVSFSLGTESANFPC
ncbi:hypothetical protein, partial [Bradyrhizobium ottawaense]|uniref:hypothetical protein n=1 Tax=Bradyrhizobium ottawaense TaxID=931866 RepID=UPI0030C7654A